MMNLNACTRLASVTSQGTPPRNILFEKDGLRRVFGGRCPDQVLGGVSTSSASSSDVGGGRAAGGALQLSLGGSGGRVVDGGGGVGEILPKSLRGEIAISDIEVGGESTGDGKGPHFIFRHFTKLERS